VEPVLGEAGLSVEVLVWESEVVGHGGDGQSVDPTKWILLNLPNEATGSICHGNGRSKVIGVVEVEGIGEGSPEDFVGVVGSVVENRIVEGLGGLRRTEGLWIAEGERCRTLNDIWA